MQPPVQPTAQPLPHIEPLLADLVEIMRLVDQCPIGQRRFFARCQSRMNGGPLTVAIAREVAAECALLNAMASVNLMTKFVLYFVAFAQYGKTNTMMCLMWIMGIERGMPTVMFTFNRANEGKRLARSSRKFNALVQRCARMMRLPASRVPELMFYNSSKPGDGERFIDAVEVGLSTKIPVYTVQGNTQKVEAAKDIISRMSLYVGRDEPDLAGPNGHSYNTGSMKALLVVDEAELAIQPEKIKRTMESGRVVEEVTPGCFNATVNSRVTLWRSVSSCY